MIVIPNFGGISSSLLHCIKRTDMSRLTQEKRTQTETQKYQIWPLRQHWGLCVITEKVDCCDFS